jgi:hypothetical protein
MGRSLESIAPDTDRISDNWVDKTRPIAWGVFDLDNLVLITGLRAEEKPSLEQRVAELEKRLDAIEKIPIVAVALSLKLSSSPSPEPHSRIRSTPTCPATCPPQLQRRRSLGEVGYADTQKN